MIWLAILTTTWAVGADSPLADSYQQEASGNYVAARQRMADVDADDVGAYFVALRTGWLSYLAGDPSAVHDYRRATILKPRSVEARLGLTLPLMASGDWTQTLLEVDQVLSVAPGQPVAQGRRAWALYNLGRFDEAVGAYQVAITAAPSDADLWSGLGWSACRSGHRDQGQHALRHALALSPNHELAGVGLAGCAD
jgi:Flp pilus assembly protein TadD